MSVNISDRAGQVEWFGNKVREATLRRDSGYIAGREEEDVFWM